LNYRAGLTLRSYPADPNGSFRSNNYATELVNLRAFTRAQPVDVFCEGAQISPSAIQFCCP
jgi:hypothetical protein